MTRRTRALLVALSGALLGCVTHSASAQVLYEPVRYEFGSGAYKFYYGGHDPRVFRHVEADVDRMTYGSKVTRQPVVQRTRVYSDAVPYADVSAHEYTSYSSYTANDARNEAYNNVPRYFRKRDLLASRDAYVTPDATVVVPAYAEPRVEIRVVRPFNVGAAPAVRRGGILIIPKKADPKQEKSVASAE